MTRLPASARSEVAPLNALTGLRFFAATEVVLFHYSPHLNSHFLKGLTLGGYQAVSFFFILSGFILTYVYSDAQGRLAVPVGRFWMARVARIVPVYFVGLALMLPVFIYGALVAKTISVAAFVSGIVLVPLFLQAWWPAAALLWNLPAWSLSVEATFYALFPLLLPLRMRALPMLALAYLLIVVSVLSRSLLAGVTPGEFRGYFPPFQLPEFILGMAIARIFLLLDGRSAVWSRWLLYISTAALIGVFGGRDWMPAWVQSDAVLALIFGGIVLGAARGQHRILGCPLLVLLGNASYAIYILHYPIGFLWRSLLSRSGVTIGEPAAFAFYASIVLAASIACYTVIEQPLRRVILDAYRISTLPGSAPVTLAGNL